MIDNVSRQESVQTFEPALTLAAAQAADADGWVDLKNHNGAAFVVHAGNWTDGTFTYVAQESDDAGVTSPINVAAAELNGTMPVIASDVQADYQVGYLGSLRYVRVQSVVTDSPSTGMIAGGSIIRSHAEQTPQ